MAWSTANNRYKQGIYRQAKKELGVWTTFYNKKIWTDCTELSLKNNGEQVESLWMKIRGQTNKALCFVFST